jgi:hypothetical protein
MAAFTVAEAQDLDVQADVLTRWLKSRGVSRQALIQEIPDPGDPHGALFDSLKTRIMVVTGKLAQHWGTRASAEIASGDATPEDIRKAIVRFLTVHGGVVQTHVVELWDRQDREIVNELLAWYDRAVPLSESRRIAELIKEPTSMESLPPQEREIRLSFKKGPYGRGGAPKRSWVSAVGERPKLSGTILRPDDPRAGKWLRDIEKDAIRLAARDAAREADHKASEKRRRAPVQIRKSAGGTYSAGPVSRKRAKRKRKKR